MAQTGYTPISIYYSSTASNTPTAGNLVAGELAINTADGKLFYKDSAGVVQVIAGKGGAGVAGGSNTQVQYNSSGSLAGSSNFVFDGTNVGIGSSTSSKLGVYGSFTKNTADENTWGVRVSDTQSMAAGVGGGLVFTGNYTSGGAAAGFASISGVKENSTTSNGLGNLVLYTTNVSSVLTERMRITGAGLVGIGTASPDARLTAYSTDNNASTKIADFYAANGTQGIYIGYDNIATTATTQPMRFVTGSTVEAMRIDSSGNVAIGTTSSSTYKLNLANNGGNQLRLYATDQSTTTTNTIDFWYIDAGGSPYNNTAIRSLSTANAGNGSLAFYTRPTSGSLTEAMRINSGGALLVGTSSGSGTAKLQVFSTLQALYANCTNNVSGDIGTVLGLGANCNNTSSYHLICATGGPDKMYILGNGNLQNTNNSYGALSDVKLKENIVDATPKLDDLMKVKVRNYNLKSDPDQKQIGVIAQELEQVFPSMIEESPDMDSERNILETTTKSVKYSVFVPMLIKAVQELKAEIDSLKAQLVK